jgi:hypothetical protein
MTHLRHSSEATRAYKTLVKAIIENGGVECEQVPDVFFPENNKMLMDRQEIELAKTICRRCPLNTECANYGIKADEAYGIYGGLTPEERRQLKRLISQHDGELEAKHQQSLPQ